MQKILICMEAIARKQDWAETSFDKSIGIIIRKLSNTNHSRENLRDNENGTSKNNQNKNSSNGVLQQFQNREKNSVNSTSTHSKGVNCISSNIVPKFLHQRTFRAQSQSPFAVATYQKQGDAHRDSSDDQKPRVPTWGCFNFLGIRRVRDF